jgi:hypothetical protein
MSNDFSLGVTGAIEPNITFFGGASKEVLRLSKDGIWANPDIPADEAAKLVLAAIDQNIKVMVDKAVEAEREACAKLVDAAKAGEEDWDSNDWNQAVEFCASRIRARGQA